MPEIDLLHTDCMEYMAGLPDKAFDLAIVDPPYGIGEHGGKRREGPKSFAKGLVSASYQKKEWDHAIPSGEYFRELARISRNQIIWGGNYFIEHLTATPCFLVWDKKTSDGSDFADCELAWTSFATAVRKFKYDWIGFGYLNNPHGERKIHPTQKPVALYRWLLKKYAKPGQRILDTHLGSGSIAIACDLEGFDLVGCEIDADYIKAARHRLSVHRSQPRLFDATEPRLTEQLSLGDDLL